MRRVILFFLNIFIILILLSCDKKIVFEDYKNEVIKDVEGFNELVKNGAKTNYKNYRFIDLRDRVSYLNLHVSTFLLSGNIEYKDNPSVIESIVDYIETNNKASYTLPIILLDSGNEDDLASYYVYTKLLELGYLNVKDIEVGFIGLKEGRKTGYSYFLQNSADCDC